MKTKRRKSKVKLWIDPKVLAKAKGKQQGEHQPILMNKYLQLADVALKNGRNHKKAA